MLKLKLQYFGHLIRRADSLEKTLMLGKIVGRRRRGTTEDEMAGWHHRLNGHGFEWALGVGDGQGGLACCGSWGRKKSDATERLNWTECYNAQALGFLLRHPELMTGAFFPWSLCCETNGPQPSASFAEGSGLSCLCSAWPLVFSYVALSHILWISRSALSYLIWVRSSSLPWLPFVTR